MFMYFRKKKRNHFANVRGFAIRFNSPTLQLEDGTALTQTAHGFSLPTISTAQARSGVSSAYFAGSVDGGNNFVTPSGPQNILDGDFLIQVSVRPQYPVGAWRYLGVDYRFAAPAIFSLGKRYSYNHGFGVFNAHLRVDTAAFYHKQGTTYGETVLPGFPENVWTDFKMARQGTTLKIFMNNSEVFSETSQTVEVYNADGVGFTIGGSIDDGRYNYRGYLDDFVFINGSSSL